MKSTLPEAAKDAKKLPPAPIPGGPAISVPIGQDEEWRKRHGLKIIGCAPNTWPPTFFVIPEKP